MKVIIKQSLYDHKQPNKKYIKENSDLYFFYDDKDEVLWLNNKDVTLDELYS